MVTVTGSAPRFPHPPRGRSTFQTTSQPIPAHFTGGGGGPRRLAAGAPAGPGAHGAHTGEGGAPRWLDRCKGSANVCRRTGGGEPALLAEGSRPGGEHSRNRLHAFRGESPKVSTVSSKLMVAPDGEVVPGGTRPPARGTPDASQGAGKAVGRPAWRRHQDQTGNGARAAGDPRGAYRNQPSLRPRFQGSWGWQTWEFWGLL